MARDLAEPTSQTIDFSTDENSASIYLNNRVELVGLRCPAMEANTAAFLIETTEDADQVVDGSATWDPVFVSTADATRRIIYGAGTSAARIAFAPDEVIIGPCRMRLVAVQNDGSTTVNQDSQVVTPKFRTY